MAKLIGLYEMPRPKGAIAASTRGALEKARQFGQPFSARQFAQWAGESGASNVNPTSLQTLLRRMTAARKSELDSNTPLLQHMAGRQGDRKNPGTWVYAYGGSAGRDEDEAEYTAAKGWRPLDEPEAEEPPEGEFSSSDDEEWDDDQPGSAKGDRDWVPQPDGMGSYAESSMEKLAAQGFGPDSDLWDRVAQTSGDVAAHALIRKELPITLQRPALAVAKEIFSNLGKDWEGGGKESFSLSRLYGLAESHCDDDEVAEAQVDPVDFAQLHGIRR